MTAKATEVEAPKRKRRSQEDVLNRIREAAQTLFAQHGYAATTVREIARVADVSQTLIFSHYGGKAGLFDEVVSAPFKRIMADFADRHKDHAADGDRDADLRLMVQQVFELLEANRDMLGALAVSTARQGPSEPHGLEEYFESAVNQIEMHFAGSDDKPRFDIRIAAPLAFGMISASVLLKNWLFPTKAPSSDELTATLSAMIVDLLTPRQDR